MNKICLIGRLTKDVELKATPSGKEIVSFNLAVQRNYKTKLKFFHNQLYLQNI